MVATPFRVRAIRVLGWTLVALLLLWPFAHRWLCVYRLVNPWKLGGFAMYTVFDPADSANVWGSADHMASPLVLAAHEQRALEEWLYWAQYLGTLYPPDQLGELLLSTRPDAPLIMLIHQRMEMDPSTGMMFWRGIVYHTTRGETGFETTLRDIQPPPGVYYSGEVTPPEALSP
jgi:hypothetical protein